MQPILLGQDQSALKQVLRCRAKTELVAEPVASIAIDGKTLRGSLDRFADVAPLQWLSAFATGQRLVLGRMALADGDKGGEIAAAQHLIEELGSRSKLFTMEAKKRCNLPCVAVATCWCR